MGQASTTPNEDWVGFADVCLVFPTISITSVTWQMFPWTQGAVKDDSCLFWQPQILKAHSMKEVSVWTPHETQNWWNLDMPKVCQVFRAMFFPHPVGLVSYLLFTVDEIYVQQRIHSKVWGNQCESLCSRWVGDDEDKKFPEKSIDKEEETQECWFPIHYHLGICVSDQQNFLTKKKITCTFWETNE